MASLLFLSEPFKKNRILQEIKKLLKMTSSEKCFISKMLHELRIYRAAMKTQTTDMTDILDKSNNVLLQIEASRSLKPAINDNSYPYAYNKETVNDLTRIVEKFMNLLSACEIPADTRSFEEYLQSAGTRKEYLESNIRKLLAIWDTIQQMRCALERQEHEVIDENVDSSF